MCLTLPKLLYQEHEQETLYELIQDIIKTDPDYRPDKFTRKTTHLHSSMQKTSTNFPIQKQKYSTTGLLKGGTMKKLNEEEERYYILYTGLSIICFLIRIQRSNKYTKNKQQVFRNENYHHQIDNSFLTNHSWKKKIQLAPPHF